tara:strand:- start:213 stop:602 length:390 start_codon:yes stop_codon:yes gene_type:complete
MGKFSEYNRLTEVSRNKAKSLFEEAVKSFDFAKWFAECSYSERAYRCSLSRTELGCTQFELQYAIMRQIRWETIFLGYDGKDKVEVSMPTGLNHKFMGGKATYQRGLYKNAEGKEIFVGFNDEFDKYRK